MPVFQRVSGHRNRFVDDQLDFPRFDFQRTLGHDFAAADDADRNNRRARLNGQVKGALLESLDFSVAASRAFGEGHDRLAFADAQRRQLQAPQGFFVVLPVDFDVARAFHGLAEDGNGKQLFFGDPAKLSRNVGQRDENVKIALVVGHQHLRFAPQEVFPADHPHFRSADRQQNPAPDVGHLVDVVFRVGKKGKDHRPE